MGRCLQLFLKQVLFEVWSHLDSRPLPRVYCLHQAYCDRGWTKSYTSLHGLPGENLTIYTLSIPPAPVVPESAPLLASACFSILHSATRPCLYHCFSSATRSSTQCRIPKRERDRTIAQALLHILRGTLVSFHRSVPCTYQSLFPQVATGRR